MKNQDNYCRICKEKCSQTLCKNCYVPLFRPIEHHVSFAFEEDIQEIDYEKLRDSEVLDYFKCSLIKAEITNFPQLRQLRISHCEQLTKIDLKDLPNLISFDAFYSPNLNEFIINNVPNLIALDLSSCPKLTEINGNFTNIEYFSISHTKISQLPSLPNVKFVDISSTQITDIKPLFSSQKLQKLITLDNPQLETIEVAQLAKLPNFASIATSTILDFKDCPTKHPLKNILCRHSPINADHVDFSHTNFDKCVHLKQSHLLFESPVCSGDWFDSYRLLYGPYPTPPNDARATVSEADFRAISGIYSAPEKVDKRLAAHHIMGALLGAAVGDCSGMFCEMKSTDKINFFNDQPLDITWTHPVKSRHGITLHRGAFTDDSALMLTFLRAAVATAIENVKSATENTDTNDCAGECCGCDVEKIFDVRQAARRIHHWIEHGMDEHLDGHGHGRGGFTTSVVRTEDFDERPIEASRQKWDEGGRKRASNGGVMRTAGCGCLLFWDEAKVIEIARRFCLCTHYDPRCVFSSVLISLIISRLIQFRCGLRSSFDLDKTIDEVKRHFIKQPPARKQQQQEQESNVIERQQVSSFCESQKGGHEAACGWRDEDFITDFELIDPFLYAENVEDLRLSDREVQRTLNTLACGIWVLRKNFGYAEGVEQVIRAGGDTDTNAAVAGAVLGAKWGIGGIPLHVLDFMWYGGILYRDAVPFLKMMGMEFEPPAYEDITQFTY